MENNVKMEAYLTLSKKGIEATKKSASTRSIEQSGDEGKDDLLYDDASWEADELYFDKDNQSIWCSGQLKSDGQVIGYFSPTLKLGNDTVIEIIEHYMKKLGKLKTVLEAIGD